SHSTTQISTLFPYTTLFRSNQSGLRETVGMTANHGLQEKRSYCFQPVIYNRKTNQNVWTPIVLPPALRVSGAERSLERHPPRTLDRKSTRLNSSHVAISYAV